MLGMRLSRYASRMHALGEQVEAECFSSFEFSSALPTSQTVRP